MTVAAILKHKGHEVASIPPSTTVAQAVEIMRDKRIGAVLVMEAADQVLGILSERDVVSSLAEHGARSLSMPASQLMTRELQTATPRTTVEEAMAMMTEGRFRHMPVIENGKLVGLVSIGDVVKARISSQEQEVDSLRAYVAGAA
jgi:CBS domain-containing protein